MPRLIDLTGKKFGRLTVTGRAENKVTSGGNPGVYWHNDRYEVYIRHNGKRIYLGSSTDFNEAKRIRFEGNDKYHKDFSFLESRNVEEYY